MARKLLVSPIGLAKYPRLNEPDTKFDDDGVYKITLELTEAEAAPLVEAIHEGQKEAVKLAKEQVKSGKKIKLADLPYAENEETGKIEVSFKRKAKGKKKDGTVFETHVALFDRHGNRLDPKGPIIGGGSRIAVSYEINPFYVAALGAGVSLRLYAVMVYDLVEYQGGTAESYGFAQAAAEVDGEEAQDADTDADDSQDEEDF